MSLKFEPAGRTSNRQHLPGQLPQQGIWARVAQHLTSWQGTLEALAQTLPDLVAATRIQVCILEGKGPGLVRVFSWRANNGHAIDEDRCCATDEGICGWALQGRSPVRRSYYVPDVSQEPRCAEVERDWGGSLLAIPLRAIPLRAIPSRAISFGRMPSAQSDAGSSEALAEPGMRVFGVLCLAREQVGAFPTEDVEHIESIADQVAALLDYALQYKRLQESVRESKRRADQQAERLRFERDRADFLHGVAQEMTRTLDLDRVLNRTLARVGHALGVRQGSVLLLDPASGFLVYRAALGRPIRLPHGGKRTPYKRGVGLGGWVLEHNQWAIVARLDQDPRWVTDPDREGESQSALALPLSSEGEVTGVLLFFHPEPGYFGEHHVALATAAATHISVAVKNAEMYRLIREQAERLGHMLREQRRIASQHVAILSSIADGLVVADEKGAIVVANDAAQRVIGVSLDELIGQQIEVLFGACPEDMQKIADQAMIEVMAASQDVQRAEPVSIILTCQERIINASFTSMLDDCGCFAGTVIVLRDITAEQELAQAKSEFVSIVSHELRTPMTSIKGYTDLLLKGAGGALNEQQIRFLSTVKANVDRMADLVQDLLDISRIEAGRIRLDLEALDMRQVVYEVSDTVAEAIRKRGLTLEIDLAPELPVVQADKNRVIQVLLNLVSNAYRYTPAGGTITLSVYPMDGALQVDVADTGIGIPREEQETIFERFYRADHPVVRQQTGTGLGLPIARSLIELHSGQLWVQSKVHQGSTFSFTLPLTEAKEASS